MKKLLKNEICESHFESCVKGTEKLIKIIFKR